MKCLAKHTVCVAQGKGKTKTVTCGQSWSLHKILLQTGDKTELEKWSLMGGSNDALVTRQPEATQGSEQGKKA